jgi:integrase
MALSLPSVSFVLYKSKVLSTGDHPVMLRVAYRANRKYYAIDRLKAKTDEWIKQDSKKGIPASFKGSKMIEKNKKLRQWEVRVANALDQFDPVKNPFSFNQFENFLFATQSKNSVYSLFEECIKSFGELNMFASRDSYKETLNRIKEFRKNQFKINEAKDISFIDLNLKFIEDFEKYYLKKGYQTSSIAVHLRGIRAVFNRAIKRGYIDQNHYPFKHFMVKIPKAKKNRSLEKDEIKLLHNYKCKPWSKEWHAINLFLFSYYTYGMNLGDMLELRWGIEINKDRILYQRNKTGTSIDIKIKQEAAEILEKYRMEHTDYAFPFYEEKITPSVKRSRNKNLQKVINKQIKIVFKNLGVPMANQITFYWARHTFTNVLLKSKVHPKIIQEMLGHQTIKTTEVYMDRVRTSDVDSMNDML